MSRWKEVIGSPRIPEWEREIREIAQSLYISKRIYEKVINISKFKYEEAKLPKYYNGNREAFLYDKTLSALFATI